MPDHPRSHRRLLAGITLILAFGAVAGCSGDSGDDASVLPALTLTLLDDGGGAELDLGAAAVAPRVINLWATWCTPCRAELPAFNTVAMAAGDSLEFLGVNVAEDAGKASTLIEELGLTFPQAVDPDGDLSAELEVVGLPSTVFATPDGEVVEIHTGPLSEEDLVRRIAELFDVTVDAT